MQQSPAGIDAGAFHTDVLAVGNESFFMLHELAFVDPDALVATLRARFGDALTIVIAKNAELPVSDAVAAYPFNSQVLTLPDGTMTIVAPAESRETPAARAFLERVIAEPGPVKSVHYLDLRESMHNGGGPACLRQRVLLTDDEALAIRARVFFDDALHADLEAWIRKSYRDRLLAERSRRSSSRARRNVGARRAHADPPSRQRLRLSSRGGLSSAANDPTPAPMRRDRLLEGALLATFVLHAVAMIGMIALLMPFLPGGGTASDADRVALIAAHPWRFRLGWLPWQLTAVSDVVLGVALLRAKWVPKTPAIVAFVLTLAAFIPDQGAQLVWDTLGVTAARAAVQSGDLSPYLANERMIFASTGAVGAALYTLGGVAWCWCFASAGTWNRALTWLSIPLYATFFAVSIGPLLPASMRMPASAAAAGNALAFVMLELWFALVAEAVLRRSRPTRAWGRDALWRHPRRGLVGRAFDLLAESRFLRALCETLAGPRIQERYPRSHLHQLRGSGRSPRSARPRRARAPAFGE